MLIAFLKQNGSKQLARNAKPTVESKIDRKMSPLRATVPFTDSFCTESLQLFP